MQPNLKCHLNVTISGQFQEVNDEVTEGRMVTAAGDASMHKRDKLGLVHVQFILW